MKLKLQNKIFLVGVIGVFITVIFLSITAFRQSRHYNNISRNEVEVLIQSNLDSITRGIYNLVEAESEAVQERVSTNLNVARKILDKYGGVRFEGKQDTWEAENQYSGEVTRLTLNNAVIAGKTIIRNTDFNRISPVVDEITDLVEGTATIFQRMNNAGDMIRVVTNVPGDSGKRAIGTYIPAVNPDGKANPVIDALMRGETYYGRAYVVNSWYITAYEPLFDSSGEINGALYVGVNQQEAENRIRRMILRTKIGKSGYVYVLGGSGHEKGRYIISRNGERDGENIWNIKDDKGNYVIRYIINTALSLYPGELKTVTYQWRNPGENDFRLKSARLAYYKPWDWVIGSSIYEDELQLYWKVLETGQMRMASIMMLAGIVMVLGTAVINILISRSIAKPVMKLTRAAEKLTDGNYGMQVKLESGDEIGILGKTFNIMSRRLRETLDGLKRTNEELEQAYTDIKKREIMYRNLFDNNVAALLIVEEDNSISMCNTAFAELAGFKDKNRIEGKMTWLDFVAGKEMLEKIKNFHDKRLKGSEDVPRSYEFRLLTKSGEKKDVINSVVQFMDTKQSLAMMLDITDRRKIQEATEKALREKIIMLQEADHRIKNNMQIILSLISLKKDRCKDSNEMAILNDIENSLRSMSVMHEMLRHDDKRGYVPLGEYVGKITELLSNSYDTQTLGIKITMDIPDVNIDAIQAVICGHIVNEVLTNAIKHAFPDRHEGIIHIEMSVDKNNTALLRIWDNGKGINPSKDKLADSSIGMILIKNLVFQIGGKVDIYSKNGTTVEISFPL